MGEFRLGTGPRVSAILLIVAGALAPAVHAEIVFTDDTAAAGLSYLQHAPQEGMNCIFAGGSIFFCEPERMSGGAAVGDVDGDGWPDLFVTRLDAHDILFRNLGDGTFADITATAGLDGFDCQTNGAAFGDIDNDGDLDLYVGIIGSHGDPTNGRNYLFMNDGTGAFVEEALPRGASMLSGGYHRIYGVTLADYDRDGWLDLHTNEWSYDGYASNSRLLRNGGAAQPGYFSNVTSSAGVGLESVRAFASAFSDLNGDAWPDLAVAGDFGTSQLFWNDGDGTFTNVTTAVGVGTDENGMGSTLGDYDGDGDLDWFVTSIYDSDQTCETEGCGWGYSGNRLYRNDGTRFHDVTDEAGVRNGYWGWGAVFFDYDNDGDLDLAMTNGVRFPGSDADAAYNDDPMRLWRNDGSGSMTEVSVEAGLDDTASGKGLLTFDYDRDGDQDLFVINNGGPPRLYTNRVGQDNDWLRVETRGSASNRQGIGARVTVLPEPGAPLQVRDVGTSGHFLGHGETTAHFGLGQGTEPVTHVRINWPSGLVQEFTDVPRNTTLVAQELACADCPNGGAAGAVSNGVGPGQVPMLLSKDASGGLFLTWTPSCDADDDDYAVYEGSLGDFTSHAPRICSTGGVSAAAFEPAPGNRYYIVAPSDRGLEGSHGRRSDRKPRSHGAYACRPPAVGSCG